MRNLSLLAAAALVICGCSHFVEVKDRPFTDDLQKKVYVTLKDVKIEERSLRKGQRINIVIVEKKDWVKLYGIPAEQERLKAEQVLLMYLFKDDFPMKAFDRDFFTSKMKEVVAEAGAKDAPRDVADKKKKNR